MNLDGIRVLLVEDNPVDARLFTELLRKAGASHLRVVQVDRLAAALDRLNRDSFDVMLLDLSLPDASGLDTLVRAHPHAPKIPIVVLTGHDDEALAVRAVRAGAQDYLVKGHVDGELLVRSIRYASERGRALDALERREEHYRSLIEHSLDLISILNLDGTIRYASPSHERLLGYPAPMRMHGLAERRSAGMFCPSCIPTTRLPSKQPSWTVTTAGRWSAAFITVTDRGECWNRFRAIFRMSLESTAWW